MGIGGIGKSQIAIEYAYRAKERASQNNEEIWLFWVYAATRARIQESFQHIANIIQLPGRDQQDSNIPQLLEKWLSNEQNGKWFLVLDSVDDSSVFRDTDREARETISSGNKRKPWWSYLPQSSHGTILITTRSNRMAWDLVNDDDCIIKVKPMEPNDALALLTTRMGPKADPSGGSALVEALEFIPLAISQAGAYIRQREELMTVASYLDRFQATDAQKIHLLCPDEDLSDIRRDWSALNSILKTFQLSFDHVSSERPSDRFALAHEFLRSPRDPKIVNSTDSRFFASL